MKKSILLIALFCYQTTHGQTTGTMTDSRDGQTYKTISYKIKGGISMTWMAENLKYKTPESQRSDKEMGLFYNWRDAMKVCPKGWHLPSNDEWTMLCSKYGGNEKAGKELKSKNGWHLGNNGTNRSGFNGFPVGYYDNYFNTFIRYGEAVGYWTSTATDNGSLWLRVLSYESIGAFSRDGLKNTSNSCRCVRD